MTPAIDIHAHALIPEVAGLVAGHPGLAREEHDSITQFGSASMAVNADLMQSTWREPLTDIGVRLDLMDASGIDIQVVSVSPTQYHYWADPDLAAAIVETANTGLLEVISGAPNRLAGFASVSLQHPELACAQLEHAVFDYGFRGVQIGSTAGGRDFSDPDLDEFWATATRLEALVFVHPWGCCLGDRLSSYYLGNIVGQPLETTVALSHLIFGGVLDRHPGLRVCGAHGGGYLPQYLGRADHAYAVRPDSHTMKCAPSAYLRELYFDSLVYRDDTLAHLVAVAGADHVLLGTDYPFDMGVTDPVDRLTALPADEREAIRGGNAQRLLSLESIGGIHR